MVFEPIWSKLQRKALTLYFRDRGLRRRDAKAAALAAIEETR